MNPAITNLAVMLGMMQVAKRIPFDDPNVLNMVRFGYILSNLIIVAVYYYVGLQIRKKNDLTTLKYTEPAPPMSTEPPKLITTTIRGHDETQLRAAYKSVAMGVGMMVVMHVYFKYTNPLLIQSVLPLKAVFENKLVQIHVLGHPASGDLKRPWKAAGNPFAALTGGGAPSTDKKGVEEAERKGTGGAKEE
ncbi:inorganic phosphate transporter Pho88 [Peziza echinospora]|nr:inorganic phosphate transporter Pho88 [Peziza echinospora]